MAFLITTPGILVEPLRFFEWFNHIRQVYAHSLSPAAQGGGLSHLARILYYLSALLFSHWTPAAMAVTVFAVLGGVKLWRESKYALVVILLFPILDTLVMAQQSQFIVRNQLPVLPFLALLAAHGVGFLAAHRKPAVRRGALGLAALIVVTNLFWLSKAADSILDRNTDRFARKMVDYVQSHSGTTFWFSDGLRRTWQSMGLSLPANLVTDPRGADRALFSAREGFQHQHVWSRMIPYLKADWFGPQEVNINCYPTWNGDDRIMLTSGKEAAKLLEK